MESKSTKKPHPRAAARAHASDETTTPVYAEDASRRINDVEYVSSNEALRMLSIKRASLYTYVSRGMIRTTAHDDGRRRLYLKSDIEKLRPRSNGASERPHVSHTLRYGEPVVQTWISEITDEGPRYRGHLATKLATAQRSFEAVAELLWTGVLNSRDAVWPQQTLPAHLGRMIGTYQAEVPGPSPLSRLTLLAQLLATPAAPEAPTHTQDPVNTGIRIIQAFSGAAGLIGSSSTYTPPREGEAIAACIARGLGQEDNADVIRIIDAALVLSAENELSPPAFAARICASTGADLYACISSALQVQSGPMQVGGTADVEIMLAALTTANAGLATRPAGYARTGLPCFNHPLYARDPRAVALLELVAGLDQPRAGTSEILDFIERTDRESGQYPNIFAALVVIACAIGLPPGTAALIHTIGRTSGWLAHVVEQRLTGAMLRPRAKYVGSRGDQGTNGL